MESQSYIVKVEHISDGPIILRTMQSIPTKGDWIKLGTEIYVIKNVTWNFSDMRTVILLVDNPKI
jgi:hypothetical protein